MLQRPDAGLIKTVSGGISAAPRDGQGRPLHCAARSSCCSRYTGCQFFSSSLPALVFISIRDKTSAGKEGGASFHGQVIKSMIKAISQQFIPRLETTLNAALKNEPLYQRSKKMR